MLLHQSPLLKHPQKGSWMQDAASPGSSPDSRHDGTAQGSRDHIYPSVSEVLRCGEPEAAHLSSQGRPGVSTQSSCWRRPPPCTEAPSFPHAHWVSDSPFLSSTPHFAVWFSLSKPQCPGSQGSVNTAHPSPCPISSRSYKNRNPCFSPSTLLLRLQNPAQASTHP